MKKLISLLLTLAMVLSICVIATVSTSAATVDMTPATAFSGGSGTAEDPFQISTVGEWLLFAQALNNGTLAQSASLVLTADIDFGGNVLPEVAGHSKGLTGNFDGQGHTISGFVLNETTASSADPYVALIGKAGGGKIANLKVDNATIVGAGTYTAPIVGYVSTTTTLENLYVGKNVTVTTPDALINDGISPNIGGAIAHARKATVKNVVSYATVAPKAVSKGANIGGVIGAIGHSGASFENVAFYGAVTVTCDNPSDGGTTSVGGVVGSLGVKSYAAVPFKNVVNFGEVVATGAKASAGGIAGLYNASKTPEFTFENCFNFSTKIEGNVNASAFIGEDRTAPTITYTECYSVEGATAAEGITVKADAYTVKQETGYADVLAAIFAGVGEVDDPITPPAQPEEPENPKTGDALGMTIAVAACAIVMGSAAAFVLARKKENA